MVIEHCTVCPRQCGARRDDTANVGGFCRMPAAPRLARAALHFGEEPCISGTRGSGTVFFSGCVLTCAFCQNAEISRGGCGETVTPSRLADIFRELEAAGAHNINLVSPTPFVPSIIAALSLYKPKIPIVYNSGGYERVETLKRLEGLVDIYLPDLKYTDNTLSAALSGAADYFDYAAPAIDEMVRQTGKAIFDKDGILQRGTVIRHLVLPGHTRASMAVLDFLKAYKDTAYISLMFQYTPLADIAGFPTLSRRLTKRECEKVWAYMEACGFENGYVQSRDSAGTQMIPAFDLTGVQTKTI